MNNRRIRYFQIIILIVLALSQPGFIPAATYAAAPDSAMKITPTPPPPGSSPNLNQLAAQTGELPPVVIDMLPAPGQEAAPDAAIELTFDQPMRRAETEAAFSLTSPDGAVISGVFSWQDAARLRFQPARALERGTAYTVTLLESALSEKGVPLGSPVTFTINTLTPLRVSQVFPASGAQGIEISSRITVTFNRPVVPLGIAEEQAALVQPLQLSPETPGSGEWISTSVYVFTPEKSLKSGTLYTASIPAGLQDAAADPQTALAAQYQWQFTTAPALLASLEIGTTLIDPVTPFTPTDIPLQPNLVISFRQAMQPESTTRAITLRDFAGKNIALKANWNAENTVITLTPAQMLRLGQSYRLNISNQAQAQDGGQLASGLDMNFITVHQPDILFTFPANNAQDTPPNFEIHFASPMNIKSVTDRVVISPAIEMENNYWYDPSSFIVYFYGFQPSTKYTITLKPGMLDLYGNAIEREQTVNFSTERTQPFGHLAMPYEAVFRAGSEMEFAVQHTNMRSAKFSLYRVTLQAYINRRELYTPINQYNFDPETLVWQYDLQTDAADNNKYTIQHIPLKQPDGTPIPPGLYFLAMASDDFGETGFDDGRFIAIINANITFKHAPGDALLWVTGFEDGKPRANVPLTLYNSRGAKIASGVTNADGLLTLDPGTPEDAYPTYYAATESTEEFLFVSSNWGSGVMSDDFGIWEQYYSPAYNDRAYIYTERPLYRPGQPVYFKGIVRADDDLRYTLPDVSSVEVTISNMDGEIYRETLDLNPYGSFNGKLTLAENIALGSYTILARYPGATTDLGSVSFTVAEYRRPEFQVDVQVNPQDVLGGRGFSFRVQSDYYSGGGVADATVNWTLQSDPFTYTPPDKYSGYSFIDRQDDFIPVWRGGEENGSSEIIADGSTRTGANGRASMELIADIAKANASRRLTLEATVTDFSGFSVSNRAELTAHRSEGYAGIRTRQYVGRAGEEQTFDLVALDWFGKPIAAQNVEVVISERRWHSVQQQDAVGNITWSSSVEDIPVKTITGLVLDQNGEGQASFTPTAGGIYRARVTALDRFGNPASASTYLWVAGEAYIPWRQTNDRSFSLVTDKTSYKPGEKAEILIASPFQGNAYALVTLERGKIRSSEVIQLKNNSTIYTIPVTADMAPLVYVSVLVVKGIDVTNPRPNFKIGMATLNVSTEQQELKVEITPDKQSAAPGEMVTYTVHTSDASGAPVSAELSLGLSDLSTLSLLPANSVPILEYFYAPRALSVRTSIGITNNIEDYNAELKAMDVPAMGRGGGSGGGKGEGEFGVPQVRSDFPDTAYWKADVVTNQQGVATVRLKLPDNLTIWRMEARAATQDTRVGQSTQDLRSTRPLLVRPQTPRFFVAGDRAVVGAAVHNNTGQDLSVTVSMDATGVTRSGDFAQELKIKNGAQAFVTWDVHIPDDSQRVDLIFSVSGGGFSDASRPTIGSLDNNGLPVYRYEVPETVATSGELAATGARAEVIRLPRGMEVSQGSLDVKIERSLAAGMTAGLKYLENYPYECAEQIVSKFLPNVLTTQALKAAGVSDPALEENLKTQVNTALQMLYGQQNSDGGWGWWRGGESQELTSAYVVLGLVEARFAGYTVDGNVLDRAITYIKQQTATLSFTGDQLANGGRNRLAFMLYVLARSGQPDVSRTVQLFDAWQSLQLYARGFLAQTLAMINANDPRITTLTTSMVNSAILSATGMHWQEKTRDYWNWNTDTRTTAILLDTMVKIDPQNALNAGAVRWLMANRKNGIWGSTQENAWTLMALTGWMVQSGELQADYSFIAALNGKTVAQGQANAANLREVTEVNLSIVDLLKDQSNALTFARDGQSGRMYYTAGLKVYLPVPQVKALDQGITISRRYVTLEDKKTAVTQAQQGDLLLAQITLVAPNDLHYVLVEDPLAAGFEAVDTSLKTSPQAAAPGTLNWERLDEDGWGWWYFSHAEMRDEKLVLSSRYLPAGTYVYTYLVRASTPGMFNVIPPTAQEFYFPEVYGRGDGSTFEVKP